MIAYEQGEEIVPVVITQSISRKQEDGRCYCNGTESEDQIPRTEATLFFAHCGYHRGVAFAVHCADLLSEKFFNERSNSVDNEDESEGTDEVPKVFFFP